MVSLFLDANILIDVTEKRRELSLESLDRYKLYLSPLSIHILAYAYKYKMPDQRLQSLLSLASIVPFDQTITTKSLEGPTDDFEDNVQLHSAAVADCNLFLTSDKLLLKIKFFGKTQIVSSLN